jgi:hypothetical protein
VFIKALNVLAAMVTASGDFLSMRFCDEAWPRMRRRLRNWGSSEGDYFSSSDTGGGVGDSSAGEDAGPPVSQQEAQKLREQLKSGGLANLNLPFKSLASASSRGVASAFDMRAYSDQQTSPSIGRSAAQPPAALQHLYKRMSKRDSLPQHQALLDCLIVCCSKLKVRAPLVLEIAEQCEPYLSDLCPAPLRERALTLFSRLVKMQPDALWLPLTQLANGALRKPPHPLMKALPVPLVRLKHPKKHMQTSAASLLKLMQV